MEIRESLQEFIADDDLTRGSDHVSFKLSGGGESIGMSHMTEITEARLRTLYKQKSFIRSDYLEDM